MKGKYRIDLSRRLERDWQSLEGEIPEAMARCKAFLANSPEDRLASGGRLKKLKGRFKGFLQYDITNEARIIYTVDKKANVVQIEYVGHHP